jgi:YVTN family beta-propeller protein
MAELAPGTVVVGCRIEGVVGRGGMGMVYRATQLSLDRLVALKAIAPELADDATFRERFKRESHIAASIEHPNVIPVYDWGEGDGVLYLIMRYVVGTDLRALIDAERGLPPPRAAWIVAQVAEALAAAHRRDLIHRDVKPANVLVDSGGERDHAYLTDFGIARNAAATSGLTRTGAVIGTLDYLPPERIQDLGGDGRSDVYALGCVLFEALTGRVAYPRDNDVAKMYAHLNAPVPSVRELAPDVPEQLDEIARRAMAKDPAHRFATAGEMADELTGTPPARTRTTPGVTAVAPTAAAAPLGISEEIALDAETADEELLPAERAAEPHTAQTGPDVAPPTAAPTAAPTAPPRPPAPAAPPRPPSRRRSVLLAAALAGTAGVAAALVLALSDGDSQDGGGTTQEREQAPPQLAFAPAGVTALAPGPDGMAADSQAATLWVANKRTDRVIAVDERDPESRQAVAVGDEPDSVAVGFGSVWVTNTRDDTVTRIDAQSRAEQDEIEVGDGPEGVAISDDAVWVANGLSDSVTRIPPDGGQPLTTTVGAGPIQLAVTGDDRLWVTLSKADQVRELDPDSGRPVGPPVQVDGQPRGIAFDGERLWVAATSANRLAVFAPDEPERVRRVDLRGPREVRFGLGAIWVTNGSFGRLVALNPDTREPVRRFDVGRLTYGLAVSDRFAWAASEETGSLLKVRPQG